MKAALRFFASLFLVIAITCASLGQKSDGQMRARGLFVNKKADAVRIVILKKEGDVYSPANPNQAFKSGDEILARFESNFDGYIYVINVEPDGKSCLIFPYPSISSNRIKAADSQELPRGATWKFNEETGTEVIQFILAREPIHYLDAAWRNPHCADLNNCCEIGLEQKSSGRKKAPQPGIQTANLARVLPGGEVSLVRSRNIVVAQGRDKEEEGSYVAIADNKGQGLALKPGQAAVFEVRLKHN